MQPPLRQWQTVAVDERSAADLARELGVPRPVAAVLVGRGLDTPERAGAFLRPRLSSLADPLRLPGMPEAVRRLWQAVTARERVTVFGDYDADGVTGTALLASLLGACGTAPACFLPSRFADGYGLSATALERCLRETQPDLLVCVDCGTNGAESVAAARAAGVDVIVTDHHAPSAEPAQPLALVNPWLAGDAADRDLAGVGVVFKLCHAFVKQGLHEGRDEIKGVDLREWLDLVALGTVADVVRLVGENRVLVRHGLERLTRTANPGLRALKEVSGLRQTLQAYHIGFVLGPRLNAAGRLGDAGDALQLLLTGEPDEARRLARKLDDANQERRRIEEEIVQAADAQVAAGFDPERDFGLVAAGEGWHIGTIGIVASRLCARYSRPVVVIASDEEGRARGSGRSVELLDLVETLRECAGCLESHGGHKMAAGLSLSATNVAAFREQFNAACRRVLAGRDLRPVQRVDAWLNLGEVDNELFAALSDLRPFGMGNPTPVWGVRELRVVGPPTRVGRGGAHLKLLVAAGGSQMEAIGFGLGECEVPETPIDAVFSLRQDTYRDRTRLQLQLQDFGPSR